MTDLTLAPLTGDQESPLTGVLPAQSRDSCPPDAKFCATFLTAFIVLSLTADAVPRRDNSHHPAC